MVPHYKTEKKKQAEVILYNLEGHLSGIQEKIDIPLGDEIVDKEVHQISPHHLCGGRNDRSVDKI